MYLHLILLYTNGSEVKLFKRPISRAHSLEYVSVLFLLMDQKANKSSVTTVPKDFSMTLILKEYFYPFLSKAHPHTTFKLTRQGLTA